MGFYAHALPGVYFFLFEKMIQKSRILNLFSVLGHADLAFPISRQVFPVFSV
jgi:hypothetical protein